MSKDLLKGMVIGAVIGATAGLLFAPKRGEETRKALMKNLEKIKDEIADKLSHVGKMTKEKYDEIVDKTINSYCEAKELTDEEAENMKNKLHDNYEKIKKALE